VSWNEEYYLFDVMPILQQIHIEGLAPLIKAFQGHPKKTRETHLFDGEKEKDEFSGFVYDGRDNQYPAQFHQGLFVSDAEVAEYKIDKGNSFRLKCFLWIIDDVSIKMIWEMTSNIKRKSYVPDKPFVCHTNITGEDGTAYIGGEMYFCKNGAIYVNFSSDRFVVVYKERQKAMAICYMEECNYKNIIS
jgi:hypothetical protein